MQLVGVLQDLPLLFLQPLELPAELLLLLLGAGFFQGRLQLLQPLVQVVLPLGQLAQAVEHLPVLALLGRFLLVLRLPLRFVAVLFVLQIELLHLLPLLLRAGDCAAARRCCRWFWRTTSCSRARSLSSA